MKLTFHSNIFDMIVVMHYTWGVLSWIVLNRIVDPEVRRLTPQNTLRSVFITADITWHLVISIETVGSNPQDYMCP